MSKKFIPAISVIIPMYNAEKYIGECLDSILAQTFQDFEVIVVDDCSTDNSCAIVEKYIRGGDSKIKLIRREKNFGCASIPRNDGIRFSCGDYIMFVDNDDAITKTALEEMYTVAKKFDADVVHAEKFYQAPGDTVTTDKKFLIPCSYEKTVFVNTPTLITENLAERVRDFGAGKFFGSPWNQLFSRKMILKHDLKFAAIKHAEDHVFDFFALCLAKNYVRVPNVFYVWRNRPDSGMRKQLTAEKYIEDWGGSVFRFIKILDDFMKDFDIFETNPEYKFAVFEEIVRANLSQVIPLYAQIPAAKLDKIVRAELDKLDDTKALTAYLFGRMNFFHVQLIRQQQIIQQLQK